MKCVVQRVISASVETDKQLCGSIKNGLLVLVGIAETDTKDTAEWMANKIANLRIFSDQDGRFNLSLKDTGGELLSVSQFTLLADIKKGTRPSFTKAAVPDAAQDLWELFGKLLTKEHGVHVEQGCFGANMQVSLVNDGPVTIVLDR